MPPTHLATTQASNWPAAIPDFNTAPLVQCEALPDGPETQGYCTGDNDEEQEFDVAI